MKGAGGVGGVDFSVRRLNQYSCHVSVCQHRDCVVWERQRKRSRHIQTVYIVFICSETLAALPHQLMQHKDTILCFSFRAAASLNWRNSSWTTWRSLERWVWGLLVYRWAKNSTFSTTCLHINRDCSFAKLCFQSPDHRDGVYMLPISKSKGRAVLREAEEEKCVCEGGNFITTCHTQIAHRFFSLPCT